MEQFDILVTRYFWRNTKDSIKNEYDIPPVRDDLELVSLTPLEQFMYEAEMDEKFLHPIHSTFLQS